MSKEKSTIWNVPNVLSVIRCMLVPVMVAFFILLDKESLAWHIVPALCFAVASLTDMLDGKIARKYNLVTNFGKFLDPLADKFLVFSALLMICVYYTDIQIVYVVVSVIVFFRELGITSLRLVVAGQKGIVVAASIWGKMKTVSQIFGILLVLMEPVLLPGLTSQGTYILSYTMAGVMVITTIFSGASYVKAYWPVIVEDKKD